MGVGLSKEWRMEGIKEVEGGMCNNRAKGLNGMGAGRADQRKPYERGITKTSDL